MKTAFRNSASLFAVALFLNTAAAQDESAVPARPGDGPAEQQGGDDGFYRASELIGTTVRGDDGKDLGKVQDLLIERRNQRIAYYLLGDGEQLNAQSNLRVIPWTVAQPQFRGNDRFVTVKLNQQRWQQAPAYTWQEIQTGPGPWVTEVDKFYGVTGRQNGRNRGRVEIERDGDVEIEGRDRPRDRDRDARPGRTEVEIERDGDVEIDNKNRRDRRDVKVDPNGVRVGDDVRVGPGGVEINSNRDEN